MALYWLAKAYLNKSTVYSESDGAMVYYSNNPSIEDPSNADYYTEWTPGTTTLNMIVPGKRPAQIQKGQIVNISTFGMVEMPEDCTGLFSGMSLMMQEDSYSLWTRATESDPYSTNYSRVKDISIDFSSFDFSNTKIMTSLFENCLKVYHTDFSAINYAGYYSYWKRYVAKTMTFAGLDSWDTSNVEKVDRMFANIIWNPSSINAGGYDTSSYDEFVPPGTTLNFPKVITATNMFANSHLDMNNLSINFGPNLTNTTFMFSNYAPHYHLSESSQNRWLDISRWSITGADVNMSSMFRNIGIQNLKLGSSLNNAIVNATSSTSINYMFANDGSVNKGTLKKIVVRAGSDWRVMNPNLAGYKMFSNLTGLSNFIATNSNNIDYANNTKSTGYFDQAPPEVTAMSYIKKNTGWLSSTIYFKTESGWKESEVYI